MVDPHRALNRHRTTTWISLYPLTACGLAWFLTEVNHFLPFSHKLEQFVFILVKNLVNNLGSREKTQQLRAPAALTEVLDSVFSTHIVAHNLSRDLTPSSDLQQAKHKFIHIK